MGLAQDSNLKRFSPREGATRVHAVRCAACVQPPWCVWQTTRIAGVLDAGLPTPIYSVASDMFSLGACLL
jgi:hypothetical protein